MLNYIIFAFAFVGVLVCCAAAGHGWEDYTNSKRRKREAKINEKLQRLQIQERFEYEEAKRLRRQADRHSRWCRDEYAAQLEAMIDGALIGTPYMTCTWGESTTTKKSNKRGKKK